MTDIDWSKAPEGATHHCGAYNEFSEVWIKDLDKNSYKFRVVGNKYADDGWEFAEPIIRDELKLLTPRPQSKPVYTQEMHDNGEEAPKGAMVDLIFNGNGTGQYVEIVVITDQYIIAKIGTLEQHYHKSGYSIKPIDQRTDEEKAIDEASKIVDSDDTCNKLNINIDCSAAMKAVICALVNNGWSKS